MSKLYALLVGINDYPAPMAKLSSDDVAMFQYCSHGARSTAGPEFHQFDLDDRDEGLVLIDSRLNNDTFNLVDKEMALLVGELATKDPHIAIIFDCCNSGSGTRAIEGGG